MSRTLQTALMLLTIVLGLHTIVAIALTSVVFYLCIGQGGEPAMPLLVIMLCVSVVLGGLTGTVHEYRRKRA